MSCGKRCMMSESNSFLSATQDGTLIRIHVQPRASRNELAGIHEGSVKVRLTAPPVEGEANKECIKFFAKLLDLPKSAVHIVQGQKSRRKTLHVKNLSLKEVERILSAQPP